MSQSNGPESASIPGSEGAPVEFSRRRPRRSDAERNRGKVLEAARRLVAERGLAAVTMDDIAAAAEVGKGTVYRGFGTRGGLAEALLDDAERELQERILQGPPPLGPGAVAADRLVAFTAAYVELLEANVELLLETERGSHGARFHTGAYGLWHAHVTALLRELGHPDEDLLAHAVLAPLSADLYQYLRHDLQDRHGKAGARPAAIKATLTHLATLLTTGRL